MSLARSSLAALLLGACTDHLLIGRIGVETEPEDAGPPAVDASLDTAVPRLDATSPPDAVIPIEAGDPLPLRASLRVFGREPLTLLTVNCGAPCTEVRAVVEGGTPPYRFRWGDGQEGNPRSICAETQVLLPAPGAPPVALEVTDSTQPTPQTVFVNPALSTPGSCTPTGGPSWNACIAPHELGAPCDGEAGLWYDLVTPWADTPAVVGMNFEIMGIEPTSVELHAAASLCGKPELLGSGAVQLFSPTLELPLPARTQRYLLLRVRPGSTATMPTLNVCFER